MKLSIVALLISLASGLAAPGSSGEPGDDTLRFFLSKSDLVVSGTITNVIVLDGGKVTYVFDFHIEDVMKGNVGLKGQSIAVAINRVEDEVPWKPSHPLLRSGGECILFLRSVKPPDKPLWQEADYWFAVQLPSSAMARSLKRLAAEK